MYYFSPKKYLAYKKRFQILELFNKINNCDQSYSLQEEPLKITREMSEGLSKIILKLKLEKKISS